MKNKKNKNTHGELECILHKKRPAASNTLLTDYYSGPSHDSESEIGFKKN